MVKPDGAPRRGRPRRRQKGPPIPTATAVTPWLWVGPKPTAQPQIEALRQRGVTHLLSVALEVNDAALFDLTGLSFLHIPWPDRADDPSPIPPLGFLEGLGWLLGGDYDRAQRGLRPPRLYVHCIRGMHRAPLMAAFLLAVLTGSKTKDALASVVARHPVTHLDDERHKPFHQALKRAVRKGRKQLAALAEAEPQTLGPLGRQAAEANAKEEAPAPPPPSVPAIAPSPSPSPPPPPHVALAYTLTDPAQWGVLAREEAQHVIARYQLSEAERGALETQAYAAMRTAFLARWAELGIHGPPPPTAIERLGREARVAASSFVRSHNLAVARMGAERARVALKRARYDGDGDGPAIPSIEREVDDELARFATKRAAIRPRDLAVYQVGIATSLADLFAGGPEDYYVVDGPPADLYNPTTGGKGCALCAAYYGQALTPTQAWQQLFPAHLGCTHVIRLGSRAERRFGI